MIMNEINKLNCITDYYIGNLAYSYYLYYRAFDLDENVQRCILDKKYIMASMVSTISDIMLSLKEEIVENVGNLNYESMVFSSSLNKTISIIANKEDKGYSINGHIIGSASYVFATIRNKLAHGEFYLDLEHSRIIFNIDNKDVIVNINDLAYFIINVFNIYITSLKSEVYEKKVLSIGNFQDNRKKAFSSSKEIESFINNLKCLNFSLSRKDGKIISLDEKARIEEVIDEYVGSTDIRVINKFYNNNKDKYDIEYNCIKVDIPDVEKLSKSIFDMTHEGTNFNDQAKFVIEKVGEIYLGNDKYENTMHFLRNLITLESIYKTGTIKTTKIRDYGQQNYPNLNMILSYEELACSLISCFSSMFSYSLDDIFENKNQYTDKEINGLDYSKLDMSKINVSKYTIDDGRYNDIVIRKNARLKDLNKINTSLERTKSQLSNISGTNVKLINLLNNRINGLNSLISNLNLEIKSYDEGINYFNSNALYFKNMSIINGIRNSISHGNFFVSRGDNFSTAKIIFEDIFEGKTTFKCEVGVLDFLYFLANNHYIIDELVSKKIDSYDERKCL